MIFIYTLCLAILARVFINPLPEAEYLIMIILGGYSSMFYYITTQVLIGMKDMRIDVEHGNLSEMWQIRMILLMAAYLVYELGHIELFYYCLPYILMGTAGDIFATLMLIGFIEYSGGDPDEED